MLSSLKSKTPSTSRAKGVSRYHLVLGFRLEGFRLQVENLKSETGNLKLISGAITGETESNSTAHHTPFVAPTPRRRSNVSAAKGLHPVTPLLFQRGTIYSSGSTFFLFDCNAIVSRLARSVKRAMSGD
jgi:hypothetical protein